MKTTRERTEEHYYQPDYKWFPAAFGTSLAVLLGGWGYSIARPVDTASPATAIENAQQDFAAEVTGSDLPTVPATETTALNVASSDVATQVEPANTTPELPAISETNYQDTVDQLTPEPDQQPDTSYQVSSEDVSSVDETDLALTDDSEVEADSDIDTLDTTHTSDLSEAPAEDLAELKAPNDVAQETPAEIDPPREDSTFSSLGNDESAKDYDVTANDVPLAPTFEESSLSAESLDEQASDLVVSDAVPQVNAEISDVPESTSTPEEDAALDVSEQTAAESELSQDTLLQIEGSEVPPAPPEHSAVAEDIVEDSVEEIATSRSSDEPQPAALAVTDEASEQPSGEEPSTVTTQDGLPNAVDFPLVVEPQTAKPTRPAFLGVGIRQPDATTVTTLHYNTTAENLGITLGDEIVAINEKPVGDLAAIRAALKKIAPEELITVTIKRQGDAYKLGPAVLTRKGASPN